MSSAPLPVDETLRLAILKSLHLLDSAPEEIFDRVVRLAAHVLNVPIAAVSLVDEHRQWFKARLGLDAPETPRDWAFCAHAILASSPLIVPDAQGDSRFVDNPLVTGDPNIRFYAGVPITSTSGAALGTLCVIDRQPRQPTPDQIQALEDLAALLRREIALRENQIAARSVSEEALGALRQSEAFFQVTFEQAAVGIAIVDLAGTWLRVNSKLAGIVGYTAEELFQLTFQDITHPDDLSQDLGLVNQLLRGEATQYQLEKRYVRKDGRFVWIHLTVSLVRNDKDEPQYFVAVIEDIDARKLAEASLQALRRDLELRVKERTASLQTANEMLMVSIQQRTESEAALRAREAELSAVLEHATDAYICIDQAGLIMEWNRQAEITFGWTRDEAVGRLLEDTIIPASHREGHRHGLQRLGRTGTSQMLNSRLELTAATRDGRSLSVEMSLYRLPLSTGSVYCAFLHDISERKALQQTLENQLRQDALTGLPNRRELMERLPQAIGRTRRSHKASAILFLDLDGFKSVNDRLGHQAGDELLRQFAQRLKNCLRETDTAARLSGDEFVVLVEFLDDPVRQTQALARKIEEVIATPFDLADRQQAHVGTSIGISVCQPDGLETAEELMASADQAMYVAKRERKSRA